MSEIPTISVTKEDDDHPNENYENGDCENDLSGISGALTDIEDMDSNDEEELGKQFFNNKNSSRRPTATDIEDFNDSGSEDEESRKYPVLMLSLQEFLNHGIFEEKTSNKRLNETSEIKSGNLLGIEKFDREDDCPTDNDNYSISSDDENFEEKSVCVDLKQMHLENINTEEHAEHVEDSPNDSADEDFSKSDCIDYFKGATAGCVSEDEIMEMSGNEEEMVVAVSSSDEDSPQEKYPIIDVKFTSKRGKKPKKETKSLQVNFLQVSTNCEESLTDIEKIDLSAAEDSGDDDGSIPIARAVILDSTDSNTDLEDINLSENPNSKCFEEIDNFNLPPPHREMVLIQEDKNGDPITNVVAMEKDFHFGLSNSNTDDLLTDIEDMSSALDDINDYSAKEVSDLGGSYEYETLKSSENVKTSSKRNDFKENLTDTEEIFMSGSVRRKKNKLKTQNKSKSKQNCLYVAGTGSDSLENCESDESNISNQQINLGIARTAEIYKNESFTVVHEKCTNMFDVQKEKNYIKGLKDCFETHTDVEYVEIEPIKENE